MREVTITVRVEGRFYPPLYDYLTHCVNLAIIAERSFQFNITRIDRGWWKNLWRSTYEVELRGDARLVNAAIIDIYRDAF